MSSSLTRRQFLQRTSLWGTAAGSLLLAEGSRVTGDEPRPKAPGFPLTVISGNPRERGRLYGSQFKDGIQSFLDREIYKAFTLKPSPKEEMLRYAGACAKATRGYSPIIHDELEGMAEGSGIRLEELVLITLHEELYHKGVLPKIEHCTAVAVGPPDTGDVNTYVGQTWDWMESVFGLSSVLHWKRPEGPSLLAYAYPGLWVGAGLNSAGLALCWTSANTRNASLGARVGISSYVLLTQLLYQASLDDAISEAKRATHAGWFTFVMGDGKGNLVNLEGSPAGLAVERHKGSLVRVGFGSREMTETPGDAKVPLHPRCQKLYEQFAGSAGKVDRSFVQHHFEDLQCGIAQPKGTIDMMVFNTTAREAYLSRGPSYGVNWKRFRFDDKE